MIRLPKREDVSLLKDSTNFRRPETRKIWKPPRLRLCSMLFCGRKRRFIICLGWDILLRIENRTHCGPGLLEAAYPGCPAMTV